MPDCDAPLDLIRLPRSLDRMIELLSARMPIRIVAIGSSSTEGDGATDPVHSSYPARLQAELRARFSQCDVTVLNKGKGGEEADVELSRFERDVKDEDPCLVIWQVGTNAAWKDRYDLNAIADNVSDGLTRLAAWGMDGVLMDIQYAPAVLAPDRLPRTLRMQQLLLERTQRAGINLFKRFDLMRHWREDDGIPFTDMISNFDGQMLHQNDWSYGCVARALADALQQNISSFSRTV